MWKIKKFLLIIGDIILLYVSLLAALFVRYGFDGFRESFVHHIIPFSALFLLWIFVFFLADLYRPTVFSTRKKLFKALFQSLIVSGIISVIFLYLFTGFFQLTPKTNLVLLGIIFFLLDLGFRILFLRIFSIGAIRVSFMGSSPFKDEVQKYLLSNPHFGYSFSEWIESPTKEDFSKFSPFGRYLVGKQNSKERRETKILVITPDLIKNPEISPRIYALLSHDVKIVNFMNFYEEIFERIPLESLKTDWFVEYITTQRPFYDVIKRIIDVILGIVIAVVLLPLGVFISILIPLTSRGSIFYRQKRMGKHGKDFVLYKFRTMKENADKNGPLWTEKNDGRITAFGKILRYTHIDETPQLINLLKGDISFTGPRPERVELAEKYSSFDYYEMRHAVKPGITGWAQINYRPSASLEEAYEKLKYDIFYIKNRSFFLDLLIMARTIKHIFLPNR